MLSSPSARLFHSLGDGFSPSRKVRPQCCWGTEDVTCPNVHTGTSPGRSCRRSHPSRSSRWPRKFSRNDSPALPAETASPLAKPRTQATLDEVRRRFGDAVAQILEDCTDPWIEPKPEWRLRKEAYSPFCLRS